MRGLLWRLLVAALIACALVYLPLPRWKVRLLLLMASPLSLLPDQLHDLIFPYSGDYSREGLLAIKSKLQANYAIVLTPVCVGWLYVPNVVIRWFSLTKCVVKQALTDRPAIIWSSLAGLVLGGAALGYLWPETRLPFGLVASALLGGVVSAWCVGVAHWGVLKVVHRRRTGVAS